MPLHLFSNAITSVFGQTPAYTNPSALILLTY